MIDDWFIPKTYAQRWAEEFQYNNHPTIKIGDIVTIYPELFPEFNGKQCRVIAITTEEVAVDGFEFLLYVDEIVLLNKW